MVIVMGTNATQADIDLVLARLAEQGCRGELTVGVERTIITVVGPTTPALQEDVRVLAHVVDVVLLGKSYDLAGLDSRPQGTSRRHRRRGAVGRDRRRAVGDHRRAGHGRVGGAARGAGRSPAAGRRRAALMGGSLRPGQSPYAFTGLGEEGLRHLAAAREATGLPVVEEAPDSASLPMVAGYADALEIGSHGMTNFGLLEAVAATGKPVILRRGFSATLDEWLLSAERILLAGNPHVVLCEAGIRTYETATSHTPDLSAIPALKRLTHLPVIADPSRACGQADLVPDLAVAAVAAGADGLVLEVHPNPDHALADGAQSLSPEAFLALSARLAALAPAVGRRLPGRPEPSPGPGGRKRPRRP